MKEELDNMVKLKVIRPIKEATPVVSPMVIVRKNGKIRICIDPSDVKKNILRRYHPLNTVEEIATKISGSKYFTLLDCKRGFWQIEVTERTQKYLTFATPWGRYCCTRLPFGLASAPEVFQEVMTSLLHDVPNPECSMDDILVHAETVKELRKVTSKVISVLEMARLKLNPEKCEFEKTSIKFLWHILTQEGLKSDPEKIKAIKDLKTPENNKKELQRLLGMVTYLNKFIPNMSEIREPLRQLLQKNVIWQRNQKQQAAVDKIKNVLSNPRY